MPPAVTAFMKVRRTIELIVERSECVVRRKVDALALAWCDACAGRVPMVTPEEAARRAGVSVRAIYRRVEAGEMHFQETAEGALLVCPDSLG
jgi:hypothetical protein